MRVAKQYQADVDAILAKRHDNGADFWAMPDGRWGVGSPFSTFDCALMLAESGTAGDGTELPMQADLVSWYHRVSGTGRAEHRPSLGIRQGGGITR